MVSECARVGLAAAHRTEAQDNGEVIQLSAAAAAAAAAAAMEPLNGQHGSGLVSCCRGLARSLPSLTRCWAGSRAAGHMSGGVCHLRFRSFPNSTTAL
jgi:hypothetical protein